MFNVLGFLLILGPLVVVHEFGHYIFARIFGVKAEIFSVGFGPKLWSRQLGETELRVSVVPLGGYVKLLGEDGTTELKPEEQKRALQNQAPWKRFFIFFGGPLFNFLFAIFIFMVILAVGEQQVGNVVGRVVRGSPAYQDGFRSGDEILKVDGKPVKKFEQIISAISDHPGQAMSFDVKHPGVARPVTINATPAPEPGYSVYGEATNVGEIDGLLAAPRGNVAGISDPASAAGKAGIKTGDRIVAFDAMPISSWEQLEQLYQAAPAGSQVTLKFEPSEVGPARTASFTKPVGASTMGQAWGLYSSELFIDKTVPKSPAEAAGLQAKDRLVAVGGDQVESFFELKDAVQHEGEKTGKVPVRWERDGKLMSATITPTGTETRDPELKKTTQYTIGVMPMLVWGDPSYIVERVWNPVLLVVKATDRMFTFTWRNIVSLRKMFTGAVSVKTLGGPILIGKIAGESLARGLNSFLTTMAILSVSLGILNVLPIPVLDGGHLLLLAIESIRRKPLTIRQMEIIQQVGLSLILLLMVIVIKNDLTRLPFFD